MLIRINIREHFNRVCKVSDGINNYNNSCSEFIEAYTLYHYMLEKRLVTHSEVQKYLTFNEKDGK